MALVFIASALLRLSDGAPSFAAIAQEVTEGMRGGDDYPSAASATPSPSEAETLLAALKTRAEELDAREQSLNDRAASLQSIAEGVEAQLTELRAAEGRLAELVDVADGAADENVARLVMIFENMKPQEATGLFAEMRPDFAAGFLRRMNPEKAAAILAGLPAEEAYAVSVTLAGHNAINIAQ
ncbi:MAG: hypothetical protein AAFQ36_08925 [Pseudomonadota bacterium]